MKGIKLYKYAEQILDKIRNETKELDSDTKNSLYEQYLNLLRKAAYSNHSEAQSDLAGHYEEFNFLGTNPCYNPEKTIYWYQKAADNNDSTACNNLAAMYISGTGCKRDIRKAISLFEKAIDLNDPSDHVKKNYLSILKEVNCAMLSNFILNTIDESVIINLLEEKKQVVSKWEIDSNGRIQRLISIEEADEYFTSFFHRIEKKMIGKFFVINKYKIQKIIRIDFPTYLMKYYHWYKSETNQKDLSKIDFLKYKTEQYLLD